MAMSFRTTFTTANLTQRVILDGEESHQRLVAVGSWLLGTRPQEPRANSQELLPRREIPLEPLRQPVQAREQHAFGDVRLIELVAHFPLERGGDDDPPVGGVAPLQQLLERERRTG